MNSKLNSDISPRLRELLKGRGKSGDSGNDVSKPIWFDENLYQKGQAFFKNHFFSILFSQLLGLLASIYSVDEFTMPLIYTGNSETPRKALKRYLSTALHIITWFENDLWGPSDQGHKDIASIRKIHRNIISSLNAKTTRELQNIKIKAKTFDSTPNLSSCLRKDLECQSGKKNLTYGKLPNNKIVIGSQFNMAMTQYAFLGFVVAHPIMTGVWWASDGELEGFLHYWRSVGWLLGMEDRFNLCRGGLKEVRSLCLEIETKIIIPQQSNISRNYEHLSESLAKGINYLIPAVSFPSLLLYIATTLNMKIPQTRRQINWNHYCQYLLMRFVFNVLLFFPLFVSLFNGLLRLSLSMYLGMPPPKWWPFKRKERQTRE